MNCRSLIICCWLCVAARIALGQTPTSVLQRVFPAGGQVGTTVEVEITGSSFGAVKTLHSNAADLQFRRLSNKKFRIQIPAAGRPGLYDLRVIGSNGVSSPRAFQISRRREVLEAAPKKAAKGSAQLVELNSIINGTIESGGDQDFYRFRARRGQRVVVECWANRVDSNLRAIIEVLDGAGRQLAVNRGYFGIDPLIDFRVPADGEYIVKVYDLVFSGGANHYYRLEVDSLPRVAFAFPNVISRGKKAQVRLFGWNLASPTQPVSTPAKPAIPPPGLESITVDVPAKSAQPMSHRQLPLRRMSAAAVFHGKALTLAGTHTPVPLAVVDGPVTYERLNNHGPQTAQPVEIPCDINGRLVLGSERDWFSFTAKQGEVLYVEAIGQRMGSPVDLDLTILDATGKRILAQFNDEVRNFGDIRLPTNHHDPSGRWVAPRDGTFTLVVRNLTGGSRSNPRRTYHVQMRREVPDVAVTVIPVAGSPAGINVSRGGRTRLEVLAVRRRGLNGSIEVRASRLPDGVECTPIFLGPGVNRASIILSASEQARLGSGDLQFVATAQRVPLRAAAAGAVVRSGRPAGWSRLVSPSPLGVVGDSAIRITANGHEKRKHHLYGDLQVRHAPGSVLDVAINVERKYSGHNSPVKLIGVGLPGQIQNQSALIPAGKSKGYISFYLPPTMRPGRYSLCVQATTTAVMANKKKQTVTLFSNPVVFDVHPAAFVVSIDPYAPRQIKRGQVLQVKYTCKRINGFISKIHSELAAPGVVTEVGGLRGRGVTFVGQSESGVIQVIANKDAPLGQQPFLRIYAVGVVEDEAIYHGSCFLQLKIVP